MEINCSALQLLCYCTALGAEGKLLYSESLTWKGFDTPAPRAPLPFLARGKDAAPAVLHMQPHLPTLPAAYLTAVTLDAGLKSCLCTYPLPSAAELLLS